jgi:Ca-activated chloride channel homolog
MFSQYLSFANPFYFLLFFLLPLAWCLQKKQKNKVVSLASNNLKGLKNLQSKRQKWQKWLFPLLQTLIFSSIITALARPQMPLREEITHQEGIDIMLVLDLSMSMLSKDFKPDRLEASKSVASSFIQKRPYDRIGLVVFSGEAFTQCPLTSDHATLQQILDGLKTGVLQDGTAIGMGLATAVSHLQDTTTKSRIVILLTDGVNNSGYISPIDAANLAKQYGIKIYTIGVGTIGEALMPIGRRPSTGEIVFDVQHVEIDEILLEQIAAASPGGTYYRATDAKQLEKIYEEINLLEKTKLDSNVIKQKTELFRPFVWFAFILLALLFILKNTIFKTLP